MATGQVCITRLGAGLREEGTVLEDGLSEADREGVSPGLYPITILSSHSKVVERFWTYLRMHS